MNETILMTYLIDGSGKFNHQGNYLAKRILSFFVILNNLVVCYNIDTTCDNHIKNYQINSID